MHGITREIETGTKTSMWKGLIGLFRQRKQTAGRKNGRVDGCGRIRIGYAAMPALRLGSRDIACVNLAACRIVITMPALRLSSRDVQNLANEIGEDQVTMPALRLSSRDTSLLASTAGFFGVTMRALPLCSRDYRLPSNNRKASAVNQSSA
jgi:hypothetical protein